MNYYKMGLVLIGTFGLFLLTSYSRAQSVKRQCVSSYGASVLMDTILWSQTVAQSYATTSFTDEENIVLHGFQQPKVFHIGDFDSRSEETLSISVYPNPASVAFILESQKVIENVTCQVFDVNGRLVLSICLDSMKRIAVPCSQWESGIFLIVIAAGDSKQVTKKLIINN
jgi:hypothetical protein